VSATTSTLSAATMSKAEALALVAGDLARVEKAIELDTVASVEAVTAIAHYLQANGGKRLRPLLVMLTARAGGDESDAPVRLGAIVEIVHTATLVHDDVIDEADVRRGRASTNKRWGNPISVLAGDWLYMQAFNLTLRERNFHLLDLVIELTQTMVEGELIQHQMVGRLDVSEQEYLDLVHRKTAWLFSVCARFGAVVAGVSEEEEERFGQYGWNLGMAFQLIDDVLDLAATEETLGKPVGNDLREGKVTLPLILALNDCSDADRALVETVIRDQGYQNVPSERILELLNKNRSIEIVHQRALDFATAASEELSWLPESPYKRALLSIPQWIVERDR